MIAFLKIASFVCVMGVEQNTQIPKDIYGESQFKAISDTNLSQENHGKHSKFHQSLTELIKQSSSSPDFLDAHCYFYGNTQEYYPWQLSTTIPVLLPRIHHLSELSEYVITPVMSSYSVFFNPGVIGKTMFFPIDVDYNYFSINYFILNSLKVNDQFRKGDIKLVEFSVGIEKDGLAIPEEIPGFYCITDASMEILDSSHHILGVKGWRSTTIDNGMPRVPKRATVTDFVRLRSVATPSAHRSQEL